MMHYFWILDSDGHLSSFCRRYRAVQSLNENETGHLYKCTTRWEKGGWERASWSLVITITVRNRKKGRNLITYIQLILKKGEKFSSMTWVTYSFFPQWLTSCLTSNLFHFSALFPHDTSAHCSTSWTNLLLFLLLLTSPKVKRKRWEESERRGRDRKERRDEKGDNHKNRTAIVATSHRITSSSSSPLIRLFFIALLHTCP